MTITAQEILHARILIVDDQEANVLLLEQMLESAGYTSVHSTMDPQHGLRAAPPHAVTT